MSIASGVPPTHVPADARELLAHVVESAVDFAIFTFAADGTTTSWNAGAERLLGFTPDEITGTSADIVFTPEDLAAGVPAKERERAQRDGRAENERWHVRKDGTRFWGSGLAMPLRSGSEGYLKILRDLTERYAAQERLRDSEERFRLLATSIPQLVFRCLPNGARLWGSPQWEEFAGLKLDESIGFQWLDALHPDDREPTLLAWQESSGTQEHYSEQRVRRDRDGEYRWHQTRARPLPEDHEWVGTMTDIHDLKTLAGRQAVLVAELQHRTRNLLAVVQSVAWQTMRRSGSFEAFSTDFLGRLRALSRVQSLLAQVEHGPVELRGLVEAELTAHGDGKGDSRDVTVGGPALALRATSAQAVALALHELATNAVKHGALSRPEGTLSVRWRVVHEGPERRVVIDWQEGGVPIPPDRPPLRRGYGTELIENALPYQLRARTRLEFGADGVRCTIDVPITQDEPGADHA